MKYILFCQKTLIKEITMDGLGIKIRKMNDNEFSEISSIFNDLFFSRKAKNSIYRYYNEYKLNKDKNINKDIRNKYLLSKHADNLTEDQINANIIYSNHVIGENIKFDKNVFNNLMMKSVIFEIDENIFEDYMDSKFISSFICNLINLGKMINNIGFKSNVNIYDYSNLLSEKSDLLINFIVASQNISNLTSLYFEERSTLETIKSLEYMNDDHTFCIFDGIKNFINSSSKEEIRSLITIMDIIFQKSTSLENEIVNYTSIIERILMNEEDEKANKFILKMGIVTQETCKVSDIKKLKKQLEFCYKVRSCIVHGNEGKLMGYYSKLDTILEGEELNKMQSLTTTRERRKYLLETTYIHLRFFIKQLMIYWIKNYQKVAFMKEN